jgi:cellulose synthase operon protein C
LPTLSHSDQKYVELGVSGYTWAVRLRTSRLALALALCGVQLAHQATAHAQDFDPRGRKKPGAKPAGKPPTGPAKPPTAVGPKPPGPAPGGKPVLPPAAGGAKEPANTAAAKTVLIERYTRIVLAQPGSPFPLQRLAQVYRERDGNIANLLKDFEARVAQGGTEVYAATVTLAGITKLDGRVDDAKKLYAKALELKATDPAALLALARLEQDTTNLAAARSLYEKALALQTVTQDQEQTLRTLLTLTLDQKDFTAAKGFHEKLVTLSKGSLYAKAEFARELFARSEFERSAAEYMLLVPAASGDNRALAPVLKDLGKAQAKAGKQAEALVTLKKALGAAGREAGVRSEVFDTIAEIHRKDQTLPALILELASASDPERLALLGTLYEETGDVPKAIATYRKVLAQNPRQLDLRLRLVRLLQSQGNLDAAIAEYEALVRASPRNPVFAFELCDALIQKGDRKRALQVLVEVEGRSGSDEEVLSRLAEFYGRIGEGDQSTRILTKLSQLNLNDPSHVLDLGNKYAQDGKPELALQTWRRILSMGLPKAKALAMLGEVLLEHDLTADGLAALREAVELDKNNVTYKKQLASALERSRNHPEALSLWNEVWQKAKDTSDRGLAREARTRIVAIWGAEKVLPAKQAGLAGWATKTPADTESGRLLADTFLRERNYASAEATLRTILDLAPGDVENMLALERALVAQNKFADAIAILERAVLADPKRARELYQRMAQYALSNFKDEDAIKYAARAVELNPDDAEGHRRLGDMYRGRQDPARAIASYKVAIAKNDRLFLVYFQLSDLLVASGDSKAADQLLRRVLRSAPDDDLVARAANQAVQINRELGTLESLEQDLLPMAIANPRRPIFRKTLIHVYDTLSEPLLRASPRTAAQEEALRKLSGRAVKPLLDALSDGDPRGERTAIDLLAYVPTKSVAASLFAFARGTSGTDLRSRALVSCGKIADPALVPQLGRLLFPPDESGETPETDKVGLAAVWAIAKTKSPNSNPILRRVLSEGTLEMRAMAALALGSLGDSAATAPLLTALGETKAMPALQVALVQSLASLRARGLRGPGGKEDARILQALVLGLSSKHPAVRFASVDGLCGGSDGDPPADGTQERHALVLALQGMLTDASSVPLPSEGANAARLSAPEVAAYGLARLARARAGSGQAASGEPKTKSSALLDLDDPLQRDITALKLGAVSPRERSASLVLYEEVIREGLLRGLSGPHPEPVITVLGSPKLAPFAVEDEAAAAVAARLRKAAEPGLAELALRGNVKDRGLALLAISRKPGAETSREVRALLDAIVRAGTTSKQWPLRHAAALALTSAQKTPFKKEAQDALETMAERDAFWIVQEAALEALAAMDLARAQRAAKKLRDAAPADAARLRSVCDRILAGGQGQKTGGAQESPRK